MIHDTRQWTVADVLAEGPCLSETEIRRHFGGRDTLTLRDILALPKLAAEYKVWMACRVGALDTAIYRHWQDAVLIRITAMYALPSAEYDMQLAELVALLEAEGTKLGTTEGSNEHV